MHLEIGQIVSQILAFLIMYWILKRYAWKPLLKILDERRQKIEAEFQTIEDQKKNNENLLDQYKDKLRQIDVEAQVKIQKAVDEGRKQAVTINNEAQEAAKATIKKAQDDLQKEIIKAKQQLKNEIVEMTLSAAQKVIHEKMDTKKENKLVSEFIDQAEEH